MIVTEASQSFTESLPLRPTFCAFTVRSFAVITRSSLETTACLQFPLIVRLPEPLSVRSALLKTAASRVVSSSVSV